MKNIFTNIIYLLVGIGLGYLLFSLNKCDSSKIIETRVVTKVDTITYEVRVEVPKYQTKYVNRRDTLYAEKLDSIDRWGFIEVPDTGQVVINQYRDSIKTEDYKLDYTIETLGHLLYFDPKFTIYRKNPQPLVIYKRPNWMVSGAVSSELNWKLGVGYKGWTAEGVFKRGFKELYVGKQFNF